MVRFGDPRAPLRFWSKVKIAASGCWLWQGCLTEKGYGQFWDGERNQRAHRYAYDRLVADFPEEWLICHRCDTPGCVNPAHLFAGTALQNTADMIEKGRHVPAPRLGDTCRRGHTLTPENTLRAGGCKACKRLKYHERKAA